MAVKKLCGIETEYGIIHQGLDDFTPSYSSSVLITAYLAEMQETQGAVAPRWDFNDEMPGNDARGFARSDVLSPEMHPHLANAILLNGARYYVDHAHPEMSSPECGDALAAVVYDCAGDEILRRSMNVVNALLPDDETILIYKNNSDGKGNSYGCHENYLMDRAVPFAEVAYGVMPHFITRQIYCGAGKVGTENTWEDAAAGERAADRFASSAGSDSSAAAPLDFQISSRADFIEAEIGLETTLKRPIVNTRDEPHSDYRRFRRLHVILGDANMSQVATLLKLGTTSLVLAMIENEALGGEIEFDNPVAAIKSISDDLTLRYPVPLADGRHVTALEIQWELLDRAQKFARQGGLEYVGEECGQLVLERWEAVLTGLEADIYSQAAVVDWVAKHRLIEGYRQRHELAADDPRLKSFDLQYHDLRLDKGLAHRVGLEQLIDPAEIERAVNQPPPDTRAYFRGKCLEQYSQHILAANWDSVLFDLGNREHHRVSLRSPFEGTAAELAEVFDNQASLEQLMEHLQIQPS